MTFLPNKYERYFSVLRSYVQRSVLKHGVKDKHLIHLRRIYNAQAYFSADEATPVNLQAYLSTLLIAIHISKIEKGMDFNFKININENCLLSLKTFTALILNLCKASSKIEICKQKGRLTIKIKSKIKKHSRRFIKKLNGCVYYEIKTETSIVTLPFTATEKVSDISNYETVEGYMTNPLSEVNIFI